MNYTSEGDLPWWLPGWLVAGSWDASFMFLYIGEFMRGTYLFFYDARVNRENV